MPLAVTVRDTSQGSRPATESNLTPARSDVRAVEPLRNESDEQTADEAKVEIVRRIRAEDASQLALRTEFEDQRLEAETRLALSVERVELEQGVASRDFLNDKVPVIVFGSLRIDVEA